MAGRLIQKQQQYLSDVVNGAFYDFCYVFLCAWMQVGSNLINQRSISVCEIKKKTTSQYCTTTGSIEPTWILSISHNCNRKLVTTLYTQDNRKNITEITRYLYVWILLDNVCKRLQQSRDRQVLHW